MLRGSVRLKLFPSMQADSILTFDGFGTRDSVEGVIDFSGTKLIRVKRQHLCRRQFLWIESASPGGVLITRSSNKAVHVLQE